MHAGLAITDLRVTQSKRRSTVTPAYLVATAIVGLSLAHTARAGELLPMQGGSVPLGPDWGSIYYTPEPNGYRIVATVAGTPADAPIRFEATLLPGQSVVLSVARGHGEKAAAVLIRRLGDRLVYDGNPTSVDPTD